MMLHKIISTNVAFLLFKLKAENIFSCVVYDCFTINISQLVELWFVHSTDYFTQLAFTRIVLYVRFAVFNIKFRLKFCYIKQLSQRLGLKLLSVRRTDEETAEKLIAAYAITLGKYRWQSAFTSAKSSLSLEIH